METECYPCIPLNNLSSALAPESAGNSFPGTAVSVPLPSPSALSAEEPPPVVKQEPASPGGAHQQQQDQTQRMEEDADSSSSSNGSSGNNFCNGSIVGGVNLGTLLPNAFVIKQEPNPGSQQLPHIKVNKLNIIQNSKISIFFDFNSIQLIQKNIF